MKRAFCFKLFDLVVLCKIVTFVALLTKKSLKNSSILKYSNYFVIFNWFANKLIWIQTEYT